MRLFVGLRLPEDVVDALGALQDTLPAERLVPEENFHITLAFLGDCDRHLAEDVATALEQLRAASFDIRLSGIDVFGGTVPRQVFAGVIACPALSGLRAQVSLAIRNAGVDLPHKRFVPHVTLARPNARREMGPRLGEWIAAQTRFSTVPFEVETISLFQSTLGRDHPIYEVIADFALQRS